MPPDDALLSDYIDRFYGYGSYAGRWWLVGMEEGGGDTVEEIEHRLRLWDSRGRRELEDVDIFADSPDLGRWFTPRPPLQPTWRGLIRLLLASEGRPTDTEAVRSYQGRELGRHGGANCILELLPLPSPSVDRWLYGDYSSLPELRSRAAYRDAVAPRRVQHLRERIREHKPKTVIFYSRAYQKWWEAIAGVGFGPAVEPGVLLARTDETLFVLTKHPTTPGVAAGYFEAAGRLIAETLTPRQSARHT